MGFGLRTFKVKTAGHRVQDRRGETGDREAELPLEAAQAEVDAGRMSRPPTLRVLVVDDHLGVVGRGRDISIMAVEQRPFAPPERRTWKGC
jgi:hypothetical protein